MDKVIKEQAIQRQILDYLKLKGFLAFKFNNYGLRGRKTYTVGISDIIGCDKNGRFVAIEVKKKGGKPTLEQTFFLERVSHNNGIAILAYSLDDVIDKLETTRKVK